MPKRAPLMLRLLGSAARAWWDDDAPRLGASLAYYTLFAIAPILLVATAIAGMFFVLAPPVTRPNHRSSHVTGGASTNDSSAASATGTSTACAQ